MVGTVGNHGRLPDDKKVPSKDPTRSWDYLAYLFARAWKRYHLRGVAFSKVPAWLLQRIVAAYNAGPRFLTRRHLYRQTREYVRNVLLFYRSPVTELR